MIVFPSTAPRPTQLLQPSLVPEKEVSPKYSAADINKKVPAYYDIMQQLQILLQQSAINVDELRKTTVLTQSNTSALQLLMSRQDRTDAVLRAIQRPSKAQSINHDDGS